MTSRLYAKRLAAVRHLKLRLFRTYNGKSRKAMSEQPQQMQCMEVWGGSQLTAQGVQFGGLDAWVYSKPYGKAHYSMIKKACERGGL